jgi:hypothetical protein
MKALSIALAFGTFAFGQQYVVIYDTTRGITTIPLSSLQPAGVAWPSPAAVSGVPLTDSNRLPYWSGVVTAEQVEGLPARIAALEAAVNLLTAQMTTVQGRLTAIESKTGLAWTFTPPLIADPAGKVSIAPCPTSDNQLLYWNGTQWLCTTLPMMSVADATVLKAGDGIRLAGPMPQQDGTVAWQLWVEDAYVAERKAVPLTRKTPCAGAGWAADENWLYVCLGTDDWRRVPLTTW